VTEASDSRRLGILDTSFWVIAYRAEVVANCLDLFQIMVPVAVEDEIQVGHQGVPEREFPYATLFRHLRGQMFDPPRNAPAPIARFGTGEAEAISLAQHLGATLLINERPAALHATSLGIRVVTVPTVIVMLRVLGVIGDRAARRKLDLIEANTAQQFIVAARRALDLLADR